MKKISIVDLVSMYQKGEGNVIEKGVMERRGMFECPFCGYLGFKTLIVSSVTERYHCIHCLEDGDAIDYLVKAKGMSDAQARDALNGLSGKDSKYASLENLKKASICRTNAEAAKFYVKELRKNKQAYGYLRSRGLTDATIKKFALGYSKQGLYNYLKSKGFDKSAMLESGLCSERKGNVRDKISGRVMFPIMADSDDGTCNVVGFGGRLMKYPDPKYPDSPKYLNTSGNAAFDKKSTLFAFNFARKSSRLSEGIILCEGYMDVIALHQAGFDNAVASLGTAFTRFHAMKLAEVTRRVYLCFDSDEAGIKAKLKAIPILRRQGLEVKILSCSPYKDPDELLKKSGRMCFENVLEFAMDSYEYEIRHIRDTAENSDDAIADFISRSHSDDYKRYLDTIKRLAGIRKDNIDPVTKEEAFYLHLIQGFKIV